MLGGGNRTEVQEETFATFSLFPGYSQVEISLVKRVFNKWDCSSDIACSEDPSVDCIRQVRFHDYVIFYRALGRRSGGEDL